MTYVHRGWCDKFDSDIIKRKVARTHFVSSKVSKSLKSCVNPASLLLLAAIGSFTRPLRERYVLVLHRSQYKCFEISCSWIFPVNQDYIICKSSKNRLPVWTEVFLGNLRQRKRWGGGGGWRTKSKMTCCHPDKKQRTEKIMSGLPDRRGGAAAAQNWNRGTPQIPNSRSILEIKQARNSYTISWNFKMDTKVGSKRAETGVGFPSRVKSLQKFLKNNDALCNEFCV